MMRGRDLHEISSDLIHGLRVKGLLTEMGVPVCLCGTDSMPGLTCQTANGMEKCAASLNPLTHKRSTW